MQNLSYTFNGSQETSEVSFVPLSSYVPGLSEASQRDRWGTFVNLDFVDASCVSSPAITQSVDICKSEIQRRLPATMFRNYCLQLHTGHCNCMRLQPITTEVGYDGAHYIVYGVREEVTIFKSPACTTEELAFNALVLVVALLRIKFEGSEKSASLLPPGMFDVPGVRYSTDIRFGASNAQRDHPLVWNNQPRPSWNTQGYPGSQPYQ